MRGSQKVGNDPVTDPGAERWMTLFIDADNRSHLLASVTTVETLQDVAAGRHRGELAYCGEPDCGKPLDLRYEMVGRSCCLLLTCPVSRYHTSRLYQRPTRAEVA